MVELETQWIHRLALFVPADQRELANAAQALYWPEGDPEVFTFSIPLSPDGILPATYYGTYTAATEMLWSVWKDLIPTVCPGAVYYRIHFNEEILLETNSPTAQAMVGSLFGWKDALSDMQLIRMEAI